MFEWVFDGDNRVIAQRLEIILLECLRREIRALATQFINLIVWAKDLACRAIDADIDILPGHIAGLCDRIHDEIEGFGRVRNGGRECAFVGDSRREPFFVQNGSHGMCDFCDGSDAFPERWQPDWSDRKFFEIEVVIDVRTACDNGAKRNWEAIGLDAAQVSEERLLHALGGGFCRGQRYG